MYPRQPQSTFWRKIRTFQIPKYKNAEGPKRYRGIEKRRMINKK